jgi:hypothetical protein
MPGPGSKRIRENEVRNKKIWLNLKKTSIMKPQSTPGGLIKRSFYVNCRFALLLLSIFTLAVFCQAPAKREFYQLKVYNFSDRSQEDRLDKYLKDAYLPALHRAGINTVGVFKPVESSGDHGKKIYVLVPFQTMDQFVRIDDVLEKDQQYITAGKSYIEARFDNPPYDRIESYLMRAFKDMPRLRVPGHSTPPGDRIYELRSYESATEDLYKRKVHMFNEGGEINIFEKLNFNAVFYGEVLSGSSMPNLIYMTTFPDMKTRDEYWGIFRADPDWDVLKVVEYYNNTVSRNNTFLLHPTDYSDI